MTTHTITLKTERTGTYEGSHGYTSPEMTTFAVCSCGWKRRIANWEYPHSREYVVEFYDMMHRLERLENPPKRFVKTRSPYELKRRSL